LKGYAEAAVRFPWKHSRHSTGRPWVGLNGTVVSFPHCEQVVRVSILGYRGGGDGAPTTASRLALQALQRFGSFLNCLSRKNDCSPAVNKNSVPQSMHFNILSWNSIEDAPFARVCTTQAGRLRTHRRAHGCADPASSPSLNFTETPGFGPAMPERHGYSYCPLLNGRALNRHRPPKGRSERK